MHERGLDARAGGAIVNAWFIRTTLPDEALVAMHAFLSPEERVRADRMFAPAPRARFIVTRAMLRMLLARAVGKEPSAIEFAYSRNGKPALSGDYAASVEFSVSHASELAVIALSAGGRVGVDVERLRPTARIERIAARLFDPETSALLASLPHHDRLLAFHHAWTQREAFVKAVGGKVFATEVPLAFHWPRASRPTFQQIAPDESWTVLPLEPAPGYVGTLVVAGAVDDIAVHGPDDDPLAGS